MTLGDIMDRIDEQKLDDYQPPRTEEPSMEQLILWDHEGGCETTDGCWVESDGYCEHGNPSWLLVLGMI